MKKKIRLVSNEEVQALFDEAEDKAKREHCKKCKDTKKRYDATRLGFREGWIYGDADTSECDGCYWHDTKFFRRIISAGYKNNPEL
jgi:hypothetical protein